MLKTKDNNPTVRRYPRTLNEAFGCDGYAITKFPGRSRFIDVAFAIALGIAGAVVLVEGFLL